MLNTLTEDQQITIAILAVNRHRAEQRFRAIRTVQCPDWPRGKENASHECMAAYNSYLSALAMLDAYLDRMDLVDVVVH
jgi:hypothetical protein